MNQCSNERVNKWMGELINQWLNEPWANEWRNRMGMEWNGVECNGVEWNGMEWNGMLEWNGMEWNGWINRWYSESMNSWVDVSVDQWTKLRRDESVNQWIRERTNDWMDRWMSAWMDVAVSCTSLLRYFFTERLFCWGTSSLSLFWAALYLGKFFWPCSELPPSYLFCSFCNRSSLRAAVTLHFANSSCNPAWYKSSTLV